jgi:hypothetical protein
MGLPIIGASSAAFERMQPYAYAQASHANNGESTQQIPFGKILISAIKRCGPDKHKSKSAL